MTLYVIAVAPAHNDAVPVTVGVVGALLLVTVKLPVVVPQLVEIDIPTLPDNAPAAHEVTIVFVPCPDVMVTFAGTVHVYVPLCEATVYVIAVCTPQIKVLPVMVGVVGKVATETETEEFITPQELPICNETFPVKVVTAHVVVMLLVPCPVVIVTPDGTVQA